MTAPKWLVVTEARGYTMDERRLECHSRRHPLIPATPNHVLETYTTAARFFVVDVVFGHHRETICINYKIMHLLNIHRYLYPLNP